MFDMSWSELLIIGGVALIVIGPKDMPYVVRSVAGLVRKARMMAGEFQSSLTEIADQADLRELRKQLIRETDDIKDNLNKEVDLMSSNAADSAAWHAGLSIFGAPLGNYGTGIQALVDNNDWQTKDDLTKAFLNWGNFGYSADGKAQSARSSLINRLKTTEIVVQNQDNREHDILDSDDYYQFEGGLATAIETLRGQAPLNFHNDHSNPDSPKIRSLAEEIGLVMRARATNPKWLKAMMRHGYKGAFELAATVDYLYGFAVTTNAVKSHHFDMLYDAYIRDDEVRNFLETHNQAALDEMRARFQDARDRGVWHPLRNFF